MKTFKRILFLLFWLIGIVALMIGAFTVRTVLFKYEAQETLEVYQTRCLQTVIDRQADGSISLRPDVSLPDQHTGIIFYTEASVEPEAYIPLLAGLCEDGYSCFVPKMPANRADMKADAADAVIEAETGIDNWFIAGHGLGGRIAARYIGEHPDKLQGLILLGAYPDRDLKDLKLPMLSVYGDLDTVMDKSAYQSSMALNPAKTETYIIKGGNHAQFGDYGPDSRDTLSFLEAEDQRAQTLQLITAWLDR